MTAKTFREILHNLYVAKTFSEILKMNDRHDELGRFTFKNVTNSGISVKTQSTSLYPDTLAGIKRGKEMSFKEADGNKCNPMNGKSGEYDLNCTACVVAFEARRRGYNISAKGYDKNTFEILENNPEKAWIDPKTNKYPKPLKDENALTARKAKQWLQEVVEEGKRYTIEHEVYSKDRERHILTVYKERGKLKLYDPQTGEKFVGEEFDKYMKTVRYKTIYKGKKIKTPINLLRVDNLAFNEKIINNVLQ